MFLFGGAFTFQQYSSLFTKDIATQEKTVVAKSIPTEIPEPNSILYVSNQTGNQEIFMLDLKTQKKTNLTENPANDMNPQLSPDGKFIVFYSDRDGDNEIYRMKLDDRSVEQLTKNNSHDYDPAYSPDGTMIAYKSTAFDQKGDIFIMDADGSNPRNLTPDRSDTEEWDPTFTLDGKKIIFVIRTNGDDMTDEIAEINTDGTGFKQLTSNNIPDWYPSIHPSLDRIVFISKTDPKNPDDIYVSALDGTDRVQMTALPGNDADPSWSQFGDKIIFINDQDGDYDIYMMNADGTHQKKLFDTYTTELSPIFLMN